MLKLVLTETERNQVPTMLPLSLLFSFYFTQLVLAQGTGNLFGFVFGLQRICFCRCGISPGSSRSDRQGRDSTPHQFPWLAAISNGTHFVGGSLVSDRHVITAASPFYGIKTGHITVSLGTHDRCGSAGDPGLNSSLETVIINPGYSPTNKNNDIALLKLRHYVTFTQFISPICLPWSTFWSQNLGQVAWTASWGLNSTTQNALCTPAVSILPIMPYETCLKVTTDSKVVTSDKACLGPWGVKGTVCSSDTGAPVMSRWTSGGPFRLVGVVSPASSCEHNSPPLFTRVADHAAWIYQTIQSDCQCL